VIGRFFYWGYKIMTIGPAFARLLIGIARGTRDPEFKAMLLLLFIAIGIGTVFYHFAQDWPWIDSFYFTVMTLTTVGDATLTPDTPLSKIFTAIYVLGGIALMLAFVTKLASFMRVRGDWD
jgi:hypothetical protein